MRFNPFVTVATVSVLMAGCSATPAPTTASAPPPPAAPVTYAPQQSPGVRDAQWRLKELGYYDGPIDGVWGSGTRDAVEDFQGSRGLTVTGQLDEPTRHVLRDAASTAPVSLSDPTSVRAVQNRLRQLHFYDGPADGVWGNGTQAAVERFQQSRGLRVGQADRATISAMGLDPRAFQARAAAAEPAAIPLDPEVVRNVQHRLHRTGFYAGPADGRWGPRTQTALERFQRSRGLEPTGELTPMTASALGLDPNNLELSAVPRR